MRAASVTVAAFAGVLALAGPRVLAQAGAAPGGPMPKVTAGGIRVVGPGLGENAREVSAFNESPGTTVVLFVTAPQGAGIVELDDDTSVLKAFTDDKGTNLLEYGRFGPFPKVTKDGSAGLIEVEVRARPAAGATSVTAQGLIGVTLATGSKPTRVANVKLEVKQTLRAGTTALTITEVTTDEDSTSITFGLPRQAMAGIRDVHFLTAQGAPIESRRTGSGYMNDAGELSYSLKTKAKVATVEFDLWQNLRAIKAPFNVKVGLGL